MGLCCCLWAFFGCTERRFLSSCGVWGFHCGGFSCCGTQARGLLYLWCQGLTAQWHVESSPTRDRTHVPWIGRWMLNHCTTKEVPQADFLHLDYECSGLSRVRVTTRFSVQLVGTSALRRQCSVILTYLKFLLGQAEEPGTQMPWVSTGGNTAMWGLPSLAFNHFKVQEGGTPQGHPQAWKEMN